MAHPEMEAAVSPAPTSVAEKAADFENFLTEAGFEDDLPQEEGEQEEFAESEGDELEFEADEADEEGEEQDEPAIDAPVSLNAEEKAVFSQLPAEAQAAWAASETRRNTQVQEATTRAKEAQRSAEQKAAQVEREAETRFGEQLRTFTSQFEPQMPDPAQYADIQQYQRDKAVYDHAKAQHDQLMQQVGSIGVETPEQKAQRIQQRDAELMQIPEIANEETRSEYIQSALSMAGELGYDANALMDTMDATDMRALAQFAKYKADSEELAKIKSSASKRKRDKSGRFTTLKPGAAPNSQNRAAGGKKAWDRVKASKKDKQAFGENSAAWLEAQGLM
jgi:hypothetical protein